MCASFCIALVAIFTAWSEIGGQSALDLMHWGWKLGLSVPLAAAIVGYTAELLKQDTIWTLRSARWLAIIVIVLLAMGIVTYYYALQVDNGDSEENGGNVSFSGLLSYHCGLSLMSSSAQPPAEYAFWQKPDTAITVVYSLNLFHEIDFVANEGYRRIPHGGVEVAGLLFGRREASGVRVEAFRSIECEHAFGPSFALSGRDLEGIEIQLKTAERDPELSGLESVGWFVGHSPVP